MVINSSDPEYRGRVQVFVPHIMPALYKDWNKEGVDIQISCVGSNIPEGLSQEVHARLVQILPWAEGASPIIGGSSPGTLFSSFASAAGAAVGAIGSAVTNFLNQGPTSDPVQVEGGDAQALIDKAKGITGLNFSGDKWGKCARGTTGLDKAAGLIDNNGAAAGFYSATDLSAGASNKTGYNPYTQGAGAKHFQPAFTVDPKSYKPQVGDSVYSAGGGLANNGHAQKCVGFDKNGEAVWVSDNPQSKFFTGSTRGSYNNFTVYRLNEVGLAKYTEAIGGKITDQVPPTTASSENTANSNPASPNPTAYAQGSSGMPETAPVPQPNIQPGGEGISGTISGGGTVTQPSLTVGSNGKADPQEMKAYLEQRLSGSKLDGYVPADAAKYGVDGSPKSWANYFTKLAEKESGFNASQKYTESFSNSKGEKVVSTGLFQVSYESVRGYGIGKGLSDQELNAKLQDPAFNIDAAIAIHEKQVLKNGVLQMPDGKGAGGYFASASMTKIAADVAAGKVDSFDSTALASDPINTSTVHNTDGNGRTPVINTNDMANGMFAYPNPGAMVWVFFREGNPLYPVYFAASYSSSEWKSAYRHGSEGELMSYADSAVRSDSSIFKPSPAGGLLTKNRINLNDPIDNESAVTLFQQHGSNITLKDGCDFFYSRNNKRDETEGDKHSITKGYKEQWVEGDYSTNVRGNMLIQIGKIDEESIKAAQELSDFSYELNQMLMEKPK